MPSSFQVFGLTLHLYGLFIGTAIIISIYLAEYALKRRAGSVAGFWKAVPIIVVAGIAGARLWHLITDWQLYTNNLVGTLFIWNGGLSIIGAVIGGAVAAWWVTRKNSSITFAELTDAVVLGLPIGQAIGRLGNWVNQELYGEPTSLPWKMYISPEKRIEGFEQDSYFHPLFAYESLLLLGITGVLWWLSGTQKFVQGKGLLTLLYVVFYSCIRFLLEFLRIDKTMFLSSGLGVNQLLVGTVAVVGGTVLIWRLVAYNNRYENN